MSINLSGHAFGYKARSIMLRAFHLLEGIGESDSGSIISQGNMTEVDHEQLMNPSKWKLKNVYWFLTTRTQIYKTILYMVVAITLNPPAFT